MGNKLCAFKSERELDKCQSEKAGEPSEVTELPNTEVKIKQDNLVAHAQVAVDVRASQVQSANLALEFDIGDDVRITGMAAVGNRLLLCDNKARSLLVYSTYGQYKQTVSLLSYPFDLALLSKMQIVAVSFQREQFIQFLKIFPTDIIAECKMDLVRPCTGGISYHHRNIAICTDKTIDIYFTNATEGHLLRSLELPYSKESPYCIKYLKEHFAFTNGECVFIHTSASNKEAFFIHTSASNNSNKPITKTKKYALATDDTNDVYIIDRTTDSLYQYSIKKGPIYKMELRTRKDGLYGPRALCFNSDLSKICISNNNGQSIYICSVK